jgi:hypothetical protein
LAKIALPQCARAPEQHLALVGEVHGDAAEHFAWLADFLAVDSPASSTLTRELMGWQPAHHGLIEDLDRGHYFRSPPA